MKAAGPRIVGGTFRGRVLAAPTGAHTRPTSIRARQALFDMLAHAPWADRAAVEGAAVLDGFAGSGALGLEALSRGAARATFVEDDPAALAAIRRNVAALGLAAQAAVLAADLRAPPPGRPHTLILLDPPYGKDLLPVSREALRRAGWFAPGCLVVAELGRLDPVPDDVPILTHKVHGAAQIVAWREV